MDLSLTSKPSKYALLQAAGPGFAVCGSVPLPAAVPSLQKLLPSTCKQWREDFESLSIQCDALLAENEEKDAEIKEKDDRIKDLTSDCQQFEDELWLLKQELQWRHAMNDVQCFFQDECESSESLFSFIN